MTRFLFSPNWTLTGFLSLSGGWRGFFSPSGCWCDFSAGLGLAWFFGRICEVCVFFSPSGGYGRFFDRGGVGGFFFLTEWGLGPFFCWIMGVETATLRGAYHAHPFRKFKI